MEPWVVGIDLGGTKVELGLVNPQDQIVAHRRIPTREFEGAQSVVERIVGSIRELETELPEGQRIAAIGICSPGPVDHEAGVLLDPPNLQGLHHAPLKQMLTDQLNLPVVLEHDAKAAGLGDFHFGVGRDEPSMVYIVIGTGVGAAIIVDGRLHRGMHNYAGEIGHSTLDRNGEICSCGSRGCVETFMSGPWLARRYLCATDINEDNSKITGETVANLAEQGDVFAQQVMTGAGEALGVAVATLAMVLDIELYVIGGSVAKAGDLLLEPARQIVPSYSHQSVASMVRIVATELGDDGPVLGCAWQARQLVV